MQKIKKKIRQLLKILTKIFLKWMMINGLIYMMLLTLFWTLMEDINKIWFERSSAECNFIENIKI